MTLRPSRDVFESHLIDDFDVLDVNYKFVSTTIMSVV